MNKYANVYFSGLKKNAFSPQSFSGLRNGAASLLNNTTQIASKIPHAAGAATGAASDISFLPGLSHAPTSLETARHTADGVASSFSLGRETAHYGSKIKPVVDMAKSVATKAEPAVNLLSRAAPTSRFLATKAAPALWALDMGVQGANLYNNPEQAKNTMQEVAGQPWYGRAWQGVKSPVETIGGTAMITGDLIRTTIDNANAPERLRQQQNELAQNSLNRSKSNLAMAATGRNPSMQLTQ